MSMGALLVPALALLGDIESQYNQLFEDHNATALDVVANCVALPDDVAATLPEGSFIMPSLGQFRMQNMALNGALDAFGKLSRFTIARGRVCFASRMMQTAFWNESVATGKVAPGLLFYETTPARGFSGMHNVNAPNDNSYVNTFALGNGKDARFFGVTDSKIAVTFDPESLDSFSDVKWNDNLDRLTLALGAAHPLPEPNGTQPRCMLGVRPQEVAMVEREVLIYRQCPDAPERRVKVAKVKTGGQLPYFHSFGVAPHHAVLPLQPITFDMMAVMTKGDVKDAFKPYHVGTNSTPIVLLPLDGTSEPTTFHLPKDTYFVHAINSFENATSVVFDATAYNYNFFDDTSLHDWLNTTTRDGVPKSHRGVATRFAMHLRGPHQGTVDVTPLSAAGRGTDFPKINAAYHAKPYCLYWAVEWWHRPPSSSAELPGEHFSRMAIVRQDVCSGARSYWYREGSFPSEPTFVARRRSGTTAAGEDTEDDGVLLFTVLDGATGTTRLMLVDARTMQTVAEAAAPRDAAIGYTTHGQWYEGVTPQPRV